MKVGGKKLLLDNFRQVLSGYSVDIQDVVRSAILDDIDISSYLYSCRSNPLRLDQIRLCLKENLDPKFVRIKDGNCIYAIRKSSKTVQKIVAEKLDDGDLQEDVLLTLIDWIESGYDLTGINMALIPKSLYPVFEQGLKKGLDMRVFNDGRKYPKDYIQLCLMIQVNGKDITPLVKVKQLWGIPCLQELVAFSRVKSKDTWSKLLENTNSSVSREKLVFLISCVKTGIDISEMGKDAWSADMVSVVLKCYDENLDCNKLLAIGPNLDKLSSTLNEMLLQKSKKTSGRFRKV